MNNIERELRVSNELRLIYNQPATQWPDAFPLGNGRLGAMVYGGARIERIFLSEGSFWSGEASAEKNLSTVHAGYLTQGDGHAFLSKSPSIYSLYYETGRREYEPAGPHEGVLTTHVAETFSAPDCLTVVGWYRKALEMCGLKGVQVREEECRAKGGSVCRYRVRWE